MLKVCTPAFVACVFLTTRIILRSISYWSAQGVKRQPGPVKAASRIADVALDFSLKKGQEKVPYLLRYKNANERVLFFRARYFHRTLCHCRRHTAISPRAMVSLRVTEPRTFTDAEDVSKITSSNIEMQLSEETISLQYKISSREETSPILRTEGSFYHRLDDKIVNWSLPLRSPL